MAKTTARKGPPAKGGSGNRVSSTAPPQKGTAARGAQAGQKGTRTPDRQKVPKAPLPAVLPGPSTLAWSVTAGAVLLGVVAITNERTEYFGSRVTVLLVLAALGLPILGLRAWRSAVVWPARAAIGFLIVAAISAALSPSPLIGFFGADQTGTGWLFLLSLAALWALGTDLGESGAELLGKGLVVLALLYAGATTLEVGGQGWSVLGTIVRHVPGMQFGLGQAVGFAPNPVYSAQIIVGGLALLAWRTASGNPRAWWITTAVLGAGTYLSGERFGLVVMVGLAIWVLVARKARAAVTFAAAAGGGLVVGIAFLKLVELGSTAHFRSIASEGGNGTVGPRLRIWSAGFHAVLHHPLVGIGPGQSQAATIPVRTVASVVHDGFFPDTHNFLVEFAVTTGLVGLGLFLAWLVPAVRRARGPLLLYSLVVLAGGLIEPLDLVTTSLAFLALGGATIARRPEPAAVPGAPERLPEWTGWAATGVRVVAVALAIFAGIAVMVGNTELRDGIAAVDPNTLAAASNHLPMWSDGPNATSDALTAIAATRPSEATSLVQLAIEWNHEAIARDPGNASSWARLGVNEDELGKLVPAASALDHSIALDPSVEQTYVDEALVAVRQGKTTAALGWARRAQGLFGAEVDPLVRCLEQHDVPGRSPDQVATACFSRSATSAQS